jgi:hypothetical protein
LHVQNVPLKPARLRGEIKEGLLMARPQKCIDSQVTHLQHLLQECAFSLLKTIRHKILSWFRRASGTVLSGTPCLHSDSLPQARQLCSDFSEHIYQTYFIATPVL